MLCVHGTREEDDILSLRPFGEHIPVLSVCCLEVADSLFLLEGPARAPQSLNLRAVPSSVSQLCSYTITGVLL